MYCFTAFLPVYRSKICRNCAQTPGFLHSGCAFRVHFICLAIHFFECLPLHSQLHLRILFEDLRFALTKQLRANTNPLQSTLVICKPRAAGSSPARSTNLFCHLWRSRAPASTVGVPPFAGFAPASRSEP